MKDSPDDAMQVGYLTVDLPVLSEVWANVSVGAFLSAVWDRLTLSEKGFSSFLFVKSHLAFVFVDSPLVGPFLPAVLQLLNLL